MERIVQSYVEQLQIGEEQSFKNLTVYPLFSSKQAYFANLTVDQWIGSRTKADSPKIKQPPSIYIFS